MIQERLHGLPGLGYQALQMGAVFTLGSLLCPLLGSPGTVPCRGWEELTSVRSVSLVWKTVDQNQALRDT